MSVDNQMWGLFFFILGSLLPGLSHAQPPTTSSATQQVSTQITRGYRLLYQSSKPQEAQHVFENAQRTLDQLLAKHKQSPQRARWLRLSANISFLLGQSYEKQQFWAQAVFAYRRCLRGTPAQRIQKVTKQALEQLLKRHSAQLTISSVPVGATVEVRYAQGWLREGTTPHTFAVLQGNVVLRLSQKGYHTLDKTLPGILAGRSYKRHFPMRLVKKPVVTSKPSPSSTSKKAAWSSLGVGVAAAIAGSIFMIVGKTTFESAHGNPDFLNKPDSAQEVRQQGRNFQIVGVVCVATAGLAFATMATLLVLQSRKPPPEIRTQVKPQSSLSRPLRNSQHHVLFFEQGEQTP